MNATWKLQDAKAQFSRVVEDAQKYGPQIVTKRGEEAVVILSIKDFRNFTSNELSFKEFLLSAPKMDEDFEFERQKDAPRSFEL